MRSKYKFSLNTSGDFSQIQKKSGSIGSDGFLVLEHVINNHMHNMTTDSCPSLSLHWLPRDLSRVLWHPIHASDSDSLQSFPSMIGSYLLMIRGHRAKSLIQPEYQVVSSWFPFHSFSYTSLTAAWLPQTIHFSGISWEVCFACLVWPFCSKYLFIFPLKKEFFFS